MLNTLKPYSVRQFLGVQHCNDAEYNHQRGEQGGNDTAVLFNEKQRIEIDAEGE